MALILCSIIENRTYIGILKLLDKWQHITSVFTSTKMSKEGLLHDCICEMNAKDLVGHIKEHLCILYQERQPTCREYTNGSKKLIRGFGAMCGRRIGELAVCCMQKCIRHLVFVSIDNK